MELGSLDSYSAITEERVACADGWGPFLKAAIPKLLQLSECCESDTHTALKATTFLQKARIHFLLADVRREHVYGKVLAP